MLEKLTEFTGFSAGLLLLAIAAGFVAGLVRGFSGFGLSAVFMAVLASIIAPIELIPIAYLLEGAASVLMIRSGWKDADRKTGLILALGSACGVPIALAFTLYLPVETSKAVALFIILTLTLMQLARIGSNTLPINTPILLFVGLLAGLVSGLAHVGGLVIALYVLACRKPPKTMRATLVLFLAIGMITSLFYQLWFGVLDLTALKRGAILVPVVIIGTALGTLLFRPALEGAYKRFCLLLLIGLSLIGLLRLANLV